MGHTVVRHASLNMVSRTPAVYVLDPYHPDAIDLLKAAPDIELVLPDDPGVSEWRSHAQGVLVRSDTQLTAKDFASASNLRVVVKQGVGVDNIDLNAARNAGVAVHNTPALNSETVAELTLALTMAIARRIPEIDRRMHDGDSIARSQTLGISLFRKKVGIIGMGNIGRMVAKKFVGACEASLIAFDPVAPPTAWNDITHTRVDDMETLLRESDIVTLHIPLLDSTRGLIGKHQLEIMKQDAILVNASRGGIIDEKALYDTMKGGKLWGAVLDAMEVEPPTREAYPELLSLPNVVITPHIGASTKECQSESGKAAARTLLRVLAGEQDVPGKLV